MTKKLNLSEAAADILGGNVSSKKGGQDSFGLGKSLNPAGVAQSQVDVGDAPTNGCAFVHIRHERNKQHERLLV
jgi:hypothetical protein